MSSSHTLICCQIKPEIQFPIYRLDARGRSLEQAVHWADQNVFTTKPHFFYDTHPPALRVRSIEQKDAGIYRCRVDFQHSPTRNWRIQLSVSGNYATG